MRDQLPGGAGRTHSKHLSVEFPVLYDDKSRIGSEDDDLILGQYEEVDEDSLTDDEKQRLALSDMVLDACDGLGDTAVFDSDLADVMDQLRQAETDFDRKQDGVGETPSEPEPEPEAAEAEYTDDEDEPDFLNAGGDDFSDGFTPIEGGDEPDFGEKEDDL